MFSNAKKELLQRYCQSATEYFEFGCGGSTQAAARILTSSKVHSVESDLQWIEKVKTAEPGIDIHHIDFGPISEFGYPATKDAYDAWPTYSQAWQTVRHKADVVLIDGRFRVACALFICLHPQTAKWILFDDFQTRKEYTCLHDFIDILETVDDMIVFRPKQSLNLEACKQAYEQYKYDPR